MIRKDQELGWAFPLLDVLISNLQSELIYEVIANKRDFISELEALSKDLPDVDIDYLFAQEV